MPNPSIRVIPCLDVSEGRVVKGVRFENLVDSGDPVELSRLYYRQGADEITLLDVDASKLGRLSLLDVVSAVAESVFIPLTVGGGVSSTDDVASLLSAGADKVAISTAGVEDDGLFSKISQQFGSQVLVVSLDIRRSSNAPSGFAITTHGGSRATAIDAMDFIGFAIKSGAGELLVNSIDQDGTRSGFDLELLEQIRAVSSVPIIASGGAGVVADFVAAAEAGADAVLAASVFHSAQLTIPEVKQALSSNQIFTRGVLA